MGKLIYAANISLDGYLEDESGSLDWSVPGRGGTNGEDPLASSSRSYDSTVPSSSVHVCSTGWT